MAYIIKSIFLTILFFILMTGIADTNMFFVSVITFLGSILFDLYFSYENTKSFPVDFSIKIVRLIITILSIIAVIGIAFSLSGLANVFQIVKFDDIRYIVFSDVFKEFTKNFLDFKISLLNFFVVLSLEILSCFPDFILSRKAKKGE